MNKNDFTNYFYDEDRSLVLKLYDKITLAEKGGSCIFTNEFYAPNLWNKLQEIVSKFNLHMEAYGGFSDSEKRMVAFYTYDIEAFPIRLMKIQNKSKFSSLEHKDYLGAIMSLGIRREKLGDLIVDVDKDCCYFSVSDDIVEFILSNLDQIGKNPCEIEEVFNFDNIPGPKLKDLLIVSTSNRLDCITSSLTGLSRTKALTMIASSKVLLNYIVETKKDKVVLEGSIVTIRGYGKFRVLDCVGSSGSGRLKINVKKYV
jgi:RNA-binding protein YlmH